MAITVYTLPRCVQCDATKRKLNDLGLDFSTADLSDPANAEQLAAFKADGLASAPIVVAHGQRWSGYRPDLLEALA